MKNIKLTICSLCSLITLILNHAAIAKTRVWNLTPTNLVVYRKEIIFDWHSSPLLRDHDYIQWRTNVNGKTTYLQEWQKEYENDSFHIPTSTISSVNKYGEAHTLRINGTFDVKMKSLRLDELNDHKFVFSFRNNNITIKKNVDLEAVKFSKIEGKNIDINNLILGDELKVNVQNSMVVNSIYPTTDSLLVFNTKKGGTFENPSLTIKSPVGSATRLSIEHLRENIHIKLGGLNDRAELLFKNHYNSKNYTITYAHLKTEEDCYHYASLGETLTDWKPLAKMAIIKSGTAMQVINTDCCHFTGGLKMLNGTLRINFNQDAKKYDFKIPYKGSVNYYIIHDSYMYQESPTTNSHGDLEMCGGTFGSTQNEYSYGAFRFTNIIYTAGTINLRLAGPNKMDSIDLTSFSARYREINTNQKKEERIGGGRISFTKNTKKFNFQFDEDLSWIIDDGSADFKINNGKGAKVITWNRRKDEGLLKDNFTANMFKSKDGKMYKPDFSVESDGLYVKYVPVPEIPQITAIIGALALTFAAIRKRKGNN